MPHPIQQRQDCGAIADRRCDGVHCARQVVRLAGKQYDVVAAVDLGLLQRAHLVVQGLAVLRLDYEAVPRELLLAPRPNQEADVRSRLQETGTVKTAQRAGAQDQPTHLTLPVLMVISMGYFGMSTPLKSTCAASAA